MEEATFDLNDGPWDTTYVSVINVIKDDGSVVIMNETIDVDLLRRGKIYNVGDYSSYKEFQIDEDSLYYMAHNAGLGGNGTIIYRCEKD